MNPNVKMNKQGVRDLNHYGPKPKPADVAEVATPVEVEATAVLPPPPEPIAPAVVPDSPTP